MSYLFENTLLSADTHPKLQPYVVYCSKKTVKRVVDLCLSLLLLFLLSPLLVAIALLVRLDSSGPVIFRQTRSGAQGRAFVMLKFRTMYHAPQRGFEQAREGDARVTRMGRFLRRTSFDELPQLINVLYGQMSLVGPRPHAPETTVEGVPFDAALANYGLRYQVKPGLTGLAQVRNQRGATPTLSVLECRLESDIEYVQTWSIELDLLILLKTLVVPFRCTNAC